MHPAQPTMPTPPVLEQRARACLITPAYEEVPVRTTLRYTPDDPLAVHIDFPAGVSAGDVSVTWAFARALLAEGLTASAGIGDVHLWPCSPAHTVVELRSPHGMAMIRFDTPTLRRFLRRSYAVVPLGGEGLGPAFDDGLASLLDGV
ncbi:SsgA family sporulation/cell division regulator [Streptomyces scabiei]|uniref:Streptomyces sporulation and cell division protein n=1 Tax=Streptomyces scabiei TaxID=1930 RepID=A0A100JPW7_STRSC|nr:SsgA family sporulation/cell division regulator [Streptomyces scabiei]GAQ63527.1 streptomyces sporulation and cell division protein [Streptomyces scabiei]